MDTSRLIPMLPPSDVLHTVSMLSSRSKDYNHKIMNIPAMWERSRGAGVKVAILDTGVPRHRDIEPAGHWSYFINYDHDRQGHSSHVGGIGHALHANDDGVSGIAPDAEDYYAAVLDASGSGSVDSIIAGIHKAVDDWGVDVINMSLGYGAGHTPALEAACNYAVSQGVTLFAAAGNEATHVGQPACYDSVIAVGAVDPRRRRAGFSNFGPEIDFVAGGVEIYSTHLDNRYARLSGTSMACPAIAAAAELIISEHKARGVKLSPVEVKEHLQRIAIDPGRGEFPDSFGAGVPVFGPSDMVHPRDRRSLVRKLASKLVFWRL